MKDLRRGVGKLPDVGITFSENAPDVVTRPIVSPDCSTNHNAPSGPAVIAKGRLDGVGIEYSVNAPEVVTRPILLKSKSVNHNAPSGPTVMPQVTPGVGVGYSVTAPEVVTLPIFESRSVNHNAPSGPEVIPWVKKSVGTGYSVSAPDVVIRPMLEPPANHNAPSGPAAIPLGNSCAASETGNSVNTPKVETRPILLASASVNHNAPSGPAVICRGSLDGVGIGYSVIVTAGAALQRPCALSCPGSFLRTCVLLKVELQQRPVSPLTSCTVTGGTAGRGSRGNTAPLPLTTTSDSFCALPFRTTLAMPSAAAEASVYL
jgi:hypothetical protein